MQKEKVEQMLTVYCWQMYSNLALNEVDNSLLLLPIKISSSDKLTLERHLRMHGRSCSNCYDYSKKKSLDVKTSSKWRNPLSDSSLGCPLLSEEAGKGLFQVTERANSVLGRLATASAEERCRFREWHFFIVWRKLLGHSLEGGGTLDWHRQTPWTCHERSWESSPEPFC